MSPALVLGLAFPLGLANGLRTFTPTAVVVWAAHLGWIHLGGTPLAFLGTTASVAIFSAFAIAELAADKHPKMAKRTEVPSMIARFVFAALAGAGFAAAGHANLVVGALLCAVGSQLGGIGGYQARVRSVRALKVPDYWVALVEDSIAIGSALLIVSRL